MVYSGASDHFGMIYAATTGQPILTSAGEAASALAPIPNAIKTSYLGFPSPVTSQLRTIARQITKGSSTPFAKAVALEKYFQSGKFTYTLGAVNLSNSARGLLTFLTTSRRGFCEQFAFAMAALARLVGIPSRIAIGYTPGSQPRGGLWQVTTADAHAWPELFFPDLGWLRFEPTPGGPSGQGTAQQPSYVIKSGPPSGGSSGPTTSAGSHRIGHIIVALQHNDVRPPITDPLAKGPPITSPVPSTRFHVPVAQILLALLALLLIAAATPGTARILSRRRRWRTAQGDAALARAAWQEVCADLEDFGLRRRHPRRCRPGPQVAGAKRGHDAPTGDPALPRVGARTSVHFRTANRWPTDRLDAIAARRLTASRAAVRTAESSRSPESCRQRGGEFPFTGELPSVRRRVFVRRRVAVRTAEGFRSPESCRPYGGGFSFAGGFSCWGAVKSPRSGKSPQPRRRF